MEYRNKKAKQHSRGLLKRTLTMALLVSGLGGMALAATPNPAACVDDGKIWYNRYDGTGASYIATTQVKPNNAGSTASGDANTTNNQLIGDIAWGADGKLYALRDGINTNTSVLYSANPSSGALTPVSTLTYSSATSNFNTLGGLPNGNLLTAVGNYSNGGGIAAAIYVIDPAKSAQTVTSQIWGQGTSFMASGLKANGDDVFATGDIVYSKGKAYALFKTDPGVFGTPTTYIFTFTVDANYQPTGYTAKALTLPNGTGVTGGTGAGAKNSWGLALYNDTVYTSYQPGSGSDSTIYTVDPSTGQMSTTGYTYLTKSPYGLSTRPEPFGGYCPPSVTVQKTTIGGVGTFGFTGNNGFTPNTSVTPATASGGTAVSITTTTTNPTVAAPKVYLWDSGISATISESTIPSGWTYSGVTCTNGTTAITPTTSGSSFTISAADVQANSGGNITCTVTNKTTTITVNKLLGGNRINSNDQFTVQINNAAGTTLTSGTATTTTGTGSTVTAGTGTTGAYLATPGTAYTIAEAMASGSTSSLSQYASTVTCTNATAGGTDVSGVTTVGASITPKLGDAITCKITNTAKPPTVILKKVSNGAVGTFNFTLTGLNNASDTVTTSTAGTAATSTQTNTGTVGTAATITETVPSGWGYTSATCTDASGSTIVTSTANGITIPAANMTAGAVITCQVTNTLQPVIKLQKVSNGGTGTFNFKLSGLNNTNDTIQTTVAGAATSSSQTNTGTVGTAATITEDLTGLPGWAYDSTKLSCTNASGATVTTTASGTSGFTVPAASMTAGAVITCKVTNNRTTATLQLRKSWVSGKSGDIARIGATTNTGISPNTTLFSANASTNPTETVTGQSEVITVYTGDTFTLFAEKMDTGLLDNYTTLLTCTNTVSALSGTNGQVDNTLQINTADAGKTIVCTYKNTRKSATLQLQKTWVNGKTNDVASIGATSNVGSTGNTTGFTATAPNTATSNIATVYAGDVVTLPGETLTTGDLNNYVATLGCGSVSSTLSGTDAKANNNTLTVSNADAGKAILCTYNNSRIAQQFKLAKQWVNVPATDTVTKVSATTTGGTNSATFSTTAPTNVTGTAVTMYAGDSVTLPVETVTTGTASATYTTTVGCTGDTTLATAAAPQTVTISASSTAQGTTCTYTNTAANATADITLDKYVRNTNNADEKFNKTAGTGYPGNVLQYCIAYTSKGSALPNFKLTDLIPANTTYVDSSLFYVSPAPDFTQLNTSPTATALPSGATNNNGTFTQTYTRADKTQYNVTGPGVQLNYGTLPAGSTATPTTGAICFSAKVN